jgi:hypothetical protein
MTWGIVDIWPKSNPFFHFFLQIMLSGSRRVKVLHESATRFTWFESFPTVLHESARRFESSEQKPIWNTVFCILPFLHCTVPRTCFIFFLACVRPDRINSISTVTSVIFFGLKRMARILLTKMGHQVTEEYKWLTINGRRRRTWWRTRRIRRERERERSSSRSGGCQQVHFYLNLSKLGVRERTGAFFHSFTYTTRYFVITFITVSVWGALNYYKDSFNCFQGKARCRASATPYASSLRPHTLVA